LPDLGYYFEPHKNEKYRTLHALISRVQLFFGGSGISEIKNELFYLPDILFDYMFVFETEKFRNTDYET
jgi:hypothetical protein